MTFLASLLFGVQQVKAGQQDHFSRDWATAVSRQNSCHSA
jgi:hypothetical protein